MTFLAFDRASARTVDQDGRLHVNGSVITAAVVSPYRGDEIPDWQRLGLDPDRVYRLLRDRDELKKAVDSFDGVPLLDRHQPATAYDHPADIVVGAVWNPKFDGERLTADLVIWPEYASRAVESGAQRDLSAGYAFRADMTPTTYRGERADGVMRDIVANHVALVVDGRTLQAMVADSALNGRSNQMKYGHVMRLVYDAAKSAARDRRARDQEEPTAEEIDDTPATAMDLAEICEAAIERMPWQEVDEFFALIAELKAIPTHKFEDRTDPDDAMDRARRGVRGARRARGAGDFLDRHVDRAHDAALPAGVKPASERFPGVGRSTSMAGRDDLTA